MLCVLRAAPRTRTMRSDVLEEKGRQLARGGPAGCLGRRGGGGSAFAGYAMYSELIARSVPWQKPRKHSSFAVSSLASRLDAATHGCKPANGNPAAAPACAAL